MDVTPQNVHSLAEKRDEENLRFRMFLKAKDMSVEELDKLVFQTTDEVWAKVDCTTCGNCCKEVGPVLNQQDVELLASRLGMTVEAVIQTYLKPEEYPDEAGQRWEMRVRPCPLLDKDNRCTVYEDRPDACRRYPYLHEPDFVFRMLGMAERASTCPIVFEVLEQLKDRTDFHAADEDGFGDDEDHMNDEWPELLETGPTPWEAIRTLAGRLKQDHELLDSILLRLRELVDRACHDHVDAEAVHLPAVLALAAASLSDEQRRRTAYALVETRKMAAEAQDEHYREVLSRAIEAFGDASVSAAPGARKHKQ